MRSNGKLIEVNISIKNSLIAGSLKALDMRSNPTKSKPKPAKIPPIILTLSFLINIIIIPMNVKTEK